MDKDLLLQLHRQLFSVRSLLQLQDTLLPSSRSATLLPNPARVEGLVASLSVLEDSDHIVSGSDSIALALLRGMPIEDAIHLLLSEEHPDGSTQNNLTILPYSQGTSAHLPLACGIAMSRKVEKQSCATLCFLNAIETYSGLFHESLLTAARHNLGITFVVFNGAQETRDEDISIRALGYPIARATAAGSDLFAVRSAAHAAILRAREEEGPSLVELKLPPSGALISDTNDTLHLFGEKLDTFGLREQRLTIEDDIANAQNVAHEIVKRRMNSETAREERYAAN